MDCNILGHKIRSVRFSKSLTQENVANDIGISITAYANIENGKTNIPFMRLCQIANYFGIELAKILTWNDPIEEDSLKEDIIEYKKKILCEEEINSLKQALENKEELLKEKERLISQQKQMLKDKDIIINDKCLIIKQLKNTSEQQ